MTSRRQTIKAGSRSDFLIAIDQGTTGTTVLVMDGSGKLRGRGYSELPQHFPRPGWVEHDGEEIWKSVLTALRQAEERSGSLDAARLATQES